jgi:hypothetical protein
MTKNSPQNPPAERKPPPAHLYSQADPIPVPEAVESDTDTVWGLWEDLIAPERGEQENSFEKTQPADLLPELPVTRLPKRQP